jgi:uncharacterized cupredoxin-like copper-binding protein
MRGITRALVLAAGLGWSAQAWTHGETHGKAPSAQPMVETPFGRTGDPKRVTRTVTVDMADTMRFTPADLTVRQGETIRFRVSNAGRVLHEMVIGTATDLQAHAELMKKHPGMEHDEPYMAHVAPGKSGEIVWQFTQAGEFEYGCLVPGHCEAGMKGRIRVLPVKETKR